MEENILKEYQKRIEEIQKELQKHQAIVSEGVEASKARTDAKEKELKARMELLNGPIDMKDVNVIDRRNPIQVEAYSDEREGFLVSEYYKRRIDGYEGPKYAEILAELRTIRETRRQEERHTTIQEVERLIDEQAEIASVREIQARQAALTGELQARRADIQQEIGANEKKIGTIEGKIEKIRAQIADSEAALKLKSLPTSAFKATVKAKLDCVNRKKEQEGVIEELKRKKAELEQEGVSIDELLAQLDGRQENIEDKEVKRQEAEMWEQYTGQPANVQEEIDQAYAEKQKLEDIEEKKRTKDTQREIQEYDEMLKSRPSGQDNTIPHIVLDIEDEEAKRQEELKRREEQRRKAREQAEIARQEAEMWEQYTGQPASVQEEIDQAYAEKQKQEEKEHEELDRQTQYEIDEYDEMLGDKPSGQDNYMPHLVLDLTDEEIKRTQENGKPPVAPKGKPNFRGQAGEKYTIQKIGFYLDEGVPTYYVVIADSKGKEIGRESKQGFEAIERLDTRGDDKDEKNRKQEMIASLEEKGIENARKYYDLGIANLLQKVDEKFGTTGLKQYNEMMVGKYDIQQKRLPIEYDFSSLQTSPIDKEEKRKINYLIKLAKENKKIGDGKITLLKAPSLLKKWLAARKRKALPEGGQPVIEEADTQEIDFDNIEVDTPDLDVITKALIDLHKNPGFEIEEFIKGYGLKGKTAEEFRNLYVKWTKDSFKEALKVAPTNQTPGSQTQEIEPEELVTEQLRTKNVEPQPIKKVIKHPIPIPKDLEIVVQYYNGRKNSDNFNLEDFIEKCRILQKDPAKKKIFLDYVEADMKTEKIAEEGREPGE